MVGKLIQDRVYADAKASVGPTDGLCQPGPEREAAVRGSGYQDVREVLVWVAPGACGA
jgi:hypothetical protein